MPEIRQVKMPFSSAMVPAYEYDGRWFHTSEGIAPLQGNRKILLVYGGIVWMASRDPINGSRWNLAGANRYRLEQDIETWMPVPDAPDEVQPHDAYTKAPRSMQSEPLKAFIKSNNITMYEVANELGIHPGTLSVWFRHDIPGDKAVRIREAVLEIKKRKRGGSNS